MTDSINELKKKLDTQKILINNLQKVIELLSEELLEQLKQFNKKEEL